MNLRIRYHVNYGAPAGLQDGPVYVASCRVEWESEVDQLDPALRAEKLETLAQQWWLQFGAGGPQMDGNRTFCERDADWPSHTVASLVSNSISFSSTSALYVEALLERLKRACWMIHIHCFHNESFEQMATQPKAAELVEVSYEAGKPQPSAQAFPNLRISPLTNPKET